MNWLFFTLLSITARSFYSIAVKVQSTQANVSAITMSILLTSFASVITIIISPLVGGIAFSEINEVWFLTLIMIISQAIGNILFFKGLEKLDAGNTQIAFSSILIWNTILSLLFLNSIFTLNQITGIVLLLFAIIIAQYSKQRKKLNAHVIYIIFAAAMFAVFQITTALLSESMSTGTYLFLSYFGSTVLTSLMYFKTISKDLEVIKNNPIVIGRNAVFVSGTSILYLLFFYYAFRLAPDKGLVAILQTSQVILSVILGILLLNEKEVIARKILAGIIAVVAGILIKS